MNATPDISIIVPMYNVESYIEPCLASLINQTYTNIEIICVDDGSTDQTKAIAETFAEKDARITILENKENCGLLFSRKRGVLASNGHFIMFLDGDDFYSENSCQVAHEAIETAKTDVLQFGMNIINSGKASAWELDSFEKFVTPYNGRLENDDVLKACFLDEKYSHNLVNKIYNAVICKKAFQRLDDAHYLMGEDLLAYFCLAWYAKSYTGIPNKLYNCNFGIGVSRPGELNPEALDKRCGAAEAVMAIQRFLKEENQLHQYQKIFQKIERRILSDNFDAWYYRLPKQYRETGYEIFERHWGKDKVMLSFLYDIENKQFDINQKTAQIHEKRNTLNHLYTENQQLQIQLNDYKEKAEAAERKYSEVMQPNSWKAGRIITWLPRKLKSMTK